MNFNEHMAHAVCVFFFFFGENCVRQKIIIIVLLEKYFLENEIFVITK